ncbi:FAD-binding oxidoreductase [Helicobacter sp. 11S02596-1]|uniref:NAD(P)/FAD-dependent oxidoreductase n=1 Tax=Helicobacter sp. 11S02596-1 TaxID=1476194 RepID=UPI000BA6DB99|nr:FAD-binding oxidoreductase [Helicobacter sp. 11S02596-1]PAF44017.1 FAD-dependent oxidoreductase [Helicobacter sp. 11S02596-1]
MTYRIKNFPQIDGDLGWFELASNRFEPVGKRLKESIKADMVVVGGGFAGVATANRLAQNHPDLKIVLIEALKIGEGTSGRNAGFVIDLPHNLDGAPANVAVDSKIYELNCFAINHLKEAVERGKIECFWQKAGKYMAAHEDTNIKGLDAFEAHLKPCGFEFLRIKGRELEKKLGTSYYQEAVYTPDNILMNPASLIRGYARTLPQNVAIYEESPIISVSYGNPHILQSLGGAVESPVVVLALDSHLEEFGLIKHKQAPIFTYASLSEVLSDEEYKKHFDGVPPYGLTSAHPAGTTLRLTPDRRIFVRNKLDFFPSLQSHHEDLQRAWEWHRQSFEARFPTLKHKRFEFTWGGMLCMTLNHEAVFGEVMKNVYVIGGSNGVGVAKGVYLGYYIAELISGKHSENLDFILKHNRASFMPPEPLRSVGARIRLWYEQKNAAKDI